MVHAASHHPDGLLEFELAAHARLWQRANRTERGRNRGSVHTVARGAEVEQRSRAATVRVMPPLIGLGLEAHGLIVRGRNDYEVGALTRHEQKVVEGARLL